MYKTFEECARALLEDPNLDDARGALVIRDSNRFDYALNGQPEPEGQLFLGIYPSATPEVKWRVMFHAGPDAERAYREFTENPDNGYFA